MFHKLIRFIKRFLLVQWTVFFKYPFSNRTFFDIAYTEYYLSKNNTYKGIQRINLLDLFPAIRANSPELHFESFCPLSPGNVSEQEIFLICTLVKFFKCKNILEIGTFNGLTTLQLALNTDNDATLFTIDLPDSEIQKTRYDLLDWEKPLVKKQGFSIGEYFKNHLVSYKITQILGDSAKIDFSPYYNSIDFAFIDGSHSYDYVKSDTENVLKCMKNGAIIVWHDFYYYDDTSVGKYLKDMSKTLQPLYNIKNTTLALYRVC